MKNQRRVGCLGLCFSGLALVYCLLGIMLAGWLSATPNFPRERTNRNLWLWGSGALLSFLLLCLFIFIFYRAGKKEPGHNEFS